MNCLICTEPNSSPTTLVVCWECRNILKIVIEDWKEFERIKKQDLEELKG